MPYSPNQPRDGDGRFAPMTGANMALHHIKHHAKSKMALASLAYKAGVRTGEPITDLALKAAHHIQDVKSKYRLRAKVQVGKRKIVNI